MRLSQVVRRLVIRGRPVHRPRVGHWALTMITVTLLYSCGGSAGSQSSSSGLPTAFPSPNSVTPAGHCDLSGVCSRFQVGEWEGVAFSPPVSCSDSGATCKLQMDIDAPTSGGPFPVVVVSPGGPQPVNSENYLTPLAVSLAGQGVVVMVSNWRQTPSNGGGLPSSFADIACAIGVARQTGPAYRASGDRVVLVGHSLGGWADAVVALTPTPFIPASGACNATAGSLRPDAFVDLAGAVDAVATPEDSNYVTAFLGGDRKSHPDAWGAADPFALAKGHPAGANGIPISLVQGTGDTDVPLEVTRSFEAALATAGYHPRLVLVAGADHASIMGAKETIYEIVALATTK